MSYSQMTARDVPDARAALITWATTNGQHVFADLGDPRLAGVLAASARAAELYYVSADMTALARQIGQTLDVFGLSSGDLPARNGLLVWDGPATSEDAGISPTAVAWSAVGASLMVSLLTPAEAYRAWCADQPTADAGLKAAPRITAGRLVYRGRGPTLPIDAPDRPWDSLGLASHEEATRTLLATLILVRQPADERRALHETEDVMPYRAARRRTERVGADPTRPVRYVTLRQSLRSSADDSDVEHAGRIYRHRWFVKAHRVRQYYPASSEHRPIWRGPYLVVPPGCEGAPILGGDRVNVLRR